METVRAGTRVIRIFQDRYNELLDMTDQLGLPLHDALELIFRRAEKGQANEGELQQCEKKLDKAEKRIKRVESKAGVKLEEIL